MIFEVKFLVKIYEDLFPVEVLTKCNRRTWITIIDRGMMTDYGLRFLGMKVHPITTKKHELWNFT